MAMPGEKAPGAFKTIGELSQELGVAQHILRYWETKFPQLKPLQRAGNRRYYRPADVELASRINRLLNQEGYTVRGVQKLLRSKDEALRAEPEEPGTIGAAERTWQETHAATQTIDVSRLAAIRDRLSDALDD
jgi:DNA-binding transcriptional MerR regulator